MDYNLLKSALADAIIQEQKDLISKYDTEIKSLFKDYVKFVDLSQELCGKCQNLNNIIEYIRANGDEKTLQIIVDAIQKFKME